MPLFALCTALVMHPFLVIKQRLSRLQTNYDEMASRMATSRLLLIFVGLDPLPQSLPCTGLMAILPAMESLRASKDDYIEGGAVGGGTIRTHNFISCPNLKVLDLHHQLVWPRYHLLHPNFSSC